jgi:hypothetical protein
MNSSRRGSITEHDITIVKPSNLSRSKLHKELAKQAIDDTFNNKQAKVN